VLKNETAQLCPLIRGERLGQKTAGTPGSDKNEDNYAPESRKVGKLLSSSA
jgi:hypothetical protein